jgi:hypothetical protein
MTLPKWVRQVSGESEAVLERFGPGRPFVFHEKDFLTPEEIEAKHAGAHGEEARCKLLKISCHFRE